MGPQYEVVLTACSITPFPLLYAPFPTPGEVAELVERA